MTKTWLKENGYMIIIMFLIILFIPLFSIFSNYMITDSWKNTCLLSNYDNAIYDGKTTLCYNSTTDEYKPAIIVAEINKKTLRGEK